MLSILNYSAVIPQTVHHIVTSLCPGYATVIRPALSSALFHEKYNDSFPFSPILSLPVHNILNKCSFVKEIVREMTNFLNHRGHREHGEKDRGKVSKWNL